MLSIYVLLFNKISFDNIYFTFSNMCYCFMCYRLTLFHLHFILILYRMDSDDSDSSDDIEEQMVDEDIEFTRLCGFAVKAIIHACTVRNIRTLVHTSDHTGHKFIHDILNGNDRRCYDMFRLHIPVFRQLCTDLASRYGLVKSRNTTTEESVAIFLITLAHGCSNRFLQEIFNHSGETIHRHFHLVLGAVLRMSADTIKPVDNYNDVVPDYILNNRRYYPMFKVYFNVLVNFMLIEF